MKFTLEHAVIAVVALALIYYMVKHRNLLADLVSIPDRDHPELKVVKDKHVKDKQKKLSPRQKAFAIDNKIPSLLQYIKPDHRGCYKNMNIWQLPGSSCYTDDG